MNISMSAFLQERDFHITMLGFLLQRVNVLTDKTRGSSQRAELMMNLAFLKGTL